MRFKVDENLPVEIADLLREAGNDAATVMDEHLAGRPDPDVASVCQAEQRAILTLDLDFSDIRSYPPEDYSGLIVLRPVLQTIPSLLRLTRRAIALLESEPLEGSLWIVEEHQVRVRRGGETA